MWAKCDEIKHALFATETIATVKHHLALNDTLTYIQCEEIHTNRDRPRLNIQRCSKAVTWFCTRDRHGQSLMANASVVGRLVVVLLAGNRWITRGTEAHCVPE